ncbi:hypothetical protein [Humidisolicoccus flavus]|uniref:hypothetical protein n=1 Tax=Humidisolicoccus flavus TaxID=3111414 RepID=UPI00324BEDA1
MHGFNSRSGHTGVVSFELQSARMWNVIVVAANIGAVVLLALSLLQPRGGSMLSFLIVGLAVLAIANFVVLPLAIVQSRKRLILDFDRGTLTVGAQTHVAEAFESAAETVRLYPGHARMLTLLYTTGEVDIQLEGFKERAGSRARNNALSEFIGRWLPMPVHYRSSVPAAPGLKRWRIGQQEALALLQSSADSNA